MWHVLLLTQRSQCLSFCSSVSYLKEENAANIKIHSGILQWIHKHNLSTPQSAHETTLHWAAWLYQSVSVKGASDFSNQQGRKRLCIFL
jgi:hypothetical protein